MLRALPPAVARELTAALAARRDAVAAALGFDAQPVEEDNGAGARAPSLQDHEECLRVLMVRLWPRFVRKQADEAAVQQALDLLRVIDAPAMDDYRYFDAFNNFWEHWPRGLDPQAEREFLRRYLALLSHHLERLAR